MYRLTSRFLLLISLTFAGAAWAQDQSSTATATCNLNADKQLAIDYQRISFNLKKMVLGGEIPYGKVWAPGGKPMTLFTNTPVEIGGANLSAGGYTVFVLPDRKQWTLIISRSTDTSGKYDASQDLVRVPMGSGELPNPESQFSVYFGHTAPNQCNLRFEVASLGTWAAFEAR